MSDLLTSCLGRAPSAAPRLSPPRPETDLLSVPSRGSEKRITRQASLRRLGLRGPLRCVVHAARQRLDTTPKQVAACGNVLTSARSPCCPGSTGCPAGLASHPNSRRLRRSTTAPASLRAPTSSFMTRGCHAPGDNANVCSVAPSAACCHAAVSDEPAQVQRHPRRSLHTPTASSEWPACAAPCVKPLGTVAAHTTRRGVPPLSSHPTLLHLDPHGAFVGATRQPASCVTLAQTGSLRCPRGAPRPSGVVWDRELQRVTAPALRGPDRLRPASPVGDRHPPCRVRPRDRAIAGLLAPPRSDPPCGVPVDGARAPLPVRGLSLNDLGGHA